MTSCRLLIDPPGAGAWNMAVDEALLEWCEQGGGCCWRFYRWQPATLSLGYFQTYGSRQQHAASLGCPAVRRPSGGGAIVHDRELTYSLVVPRRHPLGAQRHRLYETVHDSLIEVLAAAGIRAALCQGPPHDRPGPEPFLCFQRRAAGDVLVGPVKVAGSAQRRSRDALLQQGSVLLGRSAAAPELAGLAEVAGTSIEHDELAAAWLDRLADRLAFDWHREPLSHAEQERAAALVRHKYGADRWTRDRGRGSRFDSTPDCCYHRKRWG